MSEVASPETPVVKTSDDWFKENVATILDLIVSQTPFRSETEAFTLTNAIQNLSEDPATLIEEIDVRPLGTVAIDPILARVLAQNAQLVDQVTALVARLDSVAPTAPAPVAQVVTPEPAPVVTSVNDAQPVAEPLPVVSDSPVAPPSPSVG